MEVVTEEITPSIVQDEWSSLLRLTKVSNGLFFAAYFVDDAAAEYIAALIRSDTHGFTSDPLIIDNKLPDIYVSTAFAQIFSWGEANRLSERRTPIFIELYRGKSDEIWNSVRQEFFLSLNQARSRLEKEVACPLVLLLPQRCRRELATLAPDMWHIRLRSKSLTAESGARSIYSRLRRTHDHAARLIHKSGPSIMRTSESRRREALLWLRNLRWAFRYRAYIKWVPLAFDMFVAKNSEDALNILSFLFENNQLERGYRFAMRWQRYMSGLHEVRDATPWIGASFGAAAEASRRIGDLWNAEQFALVGLSHLQRSRRFDIEASYRFRTELLYRLGSIRFARGSIREAEAPLRESIQIDRMLISKSPGNLHLWQSLLASLNRLGDVLLAEGDPREALERFQESRDIALNIYPSPEISSMGAAHILRSLNGMVIASLRLSDTDTATKNRELTQRLLSAFRHRPRQSISYGTFFLLCSKILRRRKPKLKLSAIAHSWRKFEHGRIDQVVRDILCTFTWGIGWLTHLFSKDVAAHLFGRAAMSQFRRFLENDPNNLPILEKYFTSANYSFLASVNRGSKSAAMFDALEQIYCASLMSSRPLRQNSSAIFTSIVSLAFSTLLLPSKERRHFLQESEIRRELNNILDEIYPALSESCKLGVPKVKSLLDPSLEREKIVHLIAVARRDGFHAAMTVAIA